MPNIRVLIVSLLLALGAAPVLAQSANVAFGAIKADPSLPVEVTADTLDVNQEDGSAEFLGNVVVGQGEMRLSAKRVLVIYNQEASGIERMEATGDVVLVSGPDAAQAERADYTIDSGVIVMTGNVLLTQGQNALTSNKMTVNLITGTAQMVGRVKTILNSDKN
ncbi:lipopolysaccharide transport periplasmic protein LptA [Phaeobacter gallaeciensis]|uniref:Lipopolysaccharide transport periplasmic protein LptA n=2 Tax=Roseobacteraceae TaxID=2854170 RepID=A0A366WVK4_9RHOB|nr:LptA/OstA family protein [Phaeobacter gallaeciensis]MBT3142160.1 LptA/OstA family protein [Falsiruegeria litorea]MBT8168495.1 LptA/OstA family protein [Falsiruegeria litorea]RBW54020.1 lipopolysaccharide transport periplasmic protein LptA [Phaeobacter gallaeciensis]